VVAARGAIEALRQDEILLALGPPCERRVGGTGRARQAGQAGQRDRSARRHADPEQLHVQASEREGVDHHRGRPQLYDGPFARCFLASESPDFRPSKPVVTSPTIPPKVRGLSTDRSTAEWGIVMSQIAVPWLTWLFVLFVMQVGAVIVGLVILGSLPAATWIIALPRNRA